MIRGKISGGCDGEGKKRGRGRAPGMGQGGVFRKDFSMKRKFTIEGECLGDLDCRQQDPRTGVARKAKTKGVQTMLDKKRGTN